MENYLTQVQVAKRWRCHKQQVHRLLKSGLIPFVVIAGRPVIPLSTLPKSRPKPKRGPKTP